MLSYFTFPVPRLLPNTILLRSPYSTFNCQPTSQFLVYRAFQNLPGKTNAPFFGFLYLFVHTSNLTLLTSLGNYTFSYLNTIRCKLEMVGDALCNSILLLSLSYNGLLPVCGLSFLFLYAFG